MKTVEEMRQQLDSEAKQIRKSEEGSNELASKLEEMAVSDFLENTKKLRKEYPDQGKFLDSAKAALQALKREIDKEKDSEDKTKVERAIELAEKKADFFHTPKDRAYAAVNSDGKTEVLKIESKKFERWLNNQFWKSEKETINGETLNTAVSNLSGRALFEGEQIELHNRVAWKDETLWYDLADEKNRAVKITEDGWDIIQPPVLFERFQHQRKQVEPRNGDYELDRIFEVLNPCLDEDQKLLFKAQLIANFIPGFPHPIICPHGPQGSAKTSMCEVMRKLIDPSELETLQYSTSLKELTQKVSHHWFVPFDNITNLPGNVSDFLCRAVTGQGFSKRELYTDDSDIIYSFQRPIGLNGINTVPQKPDLLDRSITYPLERIPKEERKTEEEIEKTFEEMRPYLLGEIFDTISEAIELKEDIELEWKPRMADFAEWGEAIAQAMGYSEYEFMRVYQENIESSNVEAIQTHIIGKAVIQLMDGRTEWKGTPSETLEKLEEIAEQENINTNQKKWPGGPQWVKRRLNEVKANLEESGLDVSYPREGDSGQRKIHLEWNNDVSAVSSDSETDSTDDTDTTDSSSNNQKPREEIVNFLEENGISSYQEVIDNIEADESKTAQVITQLLDDGIIFEPKPGKLQKL